MAKSGKMAVSHRTVGRLSFYRRILLGLLAKGQWSVYSHELAAMSRGTAAQVRRDIMTIGASGTPTRGYEVERLIADIGKFLDAPVPQNTALVGVGNLGRAILSYFFGRSPQLTIACAFDSDPAKIGRVINGCRCYDIAEVPTVVPNANVSVGIIAVPAGEAQAVANSLCRAGVNGLLNFAPVRLWAPPSVYVEHVDMTMSLEKVAFFARLTELEKE